jgi:cell division protein FtsL
MQIPKPLLTFFITIAIALFAASLYMTFHTRELSNTLQLRISEQEKTLTALSEITDRNGADTVAEAIVRDCSSDNRGRFEELLNRLGTLTSTELSELDALFDGCASFFAERKALMVARLEREFEVYRSYVNLLSLVDQNRVQSSYSVEAWQDFVALEKQRRDLLQEQVTIQGEIISSLRSGPVMNDEIEAKLVRAAQINQEAAQLNGQIDEARRELNQL